MVDADKPAPTLFDAVDEDDPAVMRGMLDVMLAANQLGTWTLAPETMAVRWDRRLFGLFGVEPEAGRELEVWRAGLAERERLRVERELGELLARGAGVMMTSFAVRWPDGRVRQLSSRSQLITDQRGRCRLFGVNWDVTDDLRTRERLEESQELLDVAMRRAKMGAFSYHPASGQHSHSDGLFEIFGLPTDLPTEQATEAMRACMRRQDLLAVQRAADAALLERRPLSVRVRATRADDGSERHLQVSATTIARGTDVTLVGVLRDVSDEVATVDALRDAQAHHRAVTDAIPDMVLRVRADGLIMDFKPALGSRAEPASFIGQNLLDSSPAPQPITAQVLAAANAVIAGADMVVREFDADLPRWRAGTFECRFVRCGVDEAMVLVRDITQRVEAERTLRRASADATATARAKSVFLATVSHEMRTPLNGVLGMAKVLAESQLDPQQRVHLDAIALSGQALLSLVDDLLDLARIEAGGLRIEQAAFDPDDVVDEIFTIVSAAAEGRGLTLRRSRSGPKALRLLGDARRLRQVLLNLIGNALKFTDRGGVDVDVALVPTGEGEAAAAELLVAVRDTGIGIDAADLERIFEPFTQGDHSSRRRHAGSGLGLAICRQLIDRMGGHLTVQSELGAGTTFSLALALPIAPQRDDGDSEAAATGDDIAPDAARALSVLVVDDNAINRVVAAELLRGMGVVDIDVAPDGGDAIRMSAERRYDLILMDLQMPGMDGYEATERLRHDASRNRDTPVVAMTAHDFDDDRARCLASGMNGYLVKPVAPAALSPWLGRALAGRAAATTVSASAGVN